MPSKKEGAALLVESIKREISKNPASLSITELSKKVRANVHTMRQLFKQSTGATIRSYRQIIRMENAKKLLLDPHNDLLTVSIDCGYSDKVTFEKAFKKQFGITPTAFKAQFKKKTND
jgi:AraC-like DNA-binding protein